MDKDRKKLLSYDTEIYVSGINADGDGVITNLFDPNYKMLSHIWYIDEAEMMALVDKANKEGLQMAWSEENEYRPTLHDPDPPTPEQLAFWKREERDAKLAATDKYMRPDFPISEVERELVVKYSQWLRDLPTLAEFPNVEIPTVEEWLAANKATY